MLEALSRNWWIIALRGLFAVVFGVLTLVWPGVTILALVLIWGIYALVDGVSSIALGMATRTASGTQRWAYIALGIIGVLAGLAAIVVPGVTALALLIIIAIWAILLGVLQLLATVWLRRVTPHAWFLAVTGLLTLVLGIVLLVNPGPGAVVLVTTIAFFALLWGISLILFSLRLRGLHGRTSPLASGT